MSPAEFLRALWPAHGHYVIATPVKIPGVKNNPYTHKVFTAIDQAVAAVEVLKPHKDMFFAIHTAKQPQVWNPTKHNYKTGEPGAYEIRVQGNMLMAQCFFFDLDVGEKKEYKTQAEAVQDLIRFCKEVSLPRPMVVSSGGGLHVYWRVAEPILSNEWQITAAKLKQLAKHHGLKPDPARTTDTSSVLRIAGTFNLKDPTNPREVRVLAMDAGRIDNERFLQIINDAIIRAGVNVVPPRNPMLDILGSNTEEIHVGPPVSFRALVEACPQMQRIVKLKGNVSEPEWYQSINLVRFVANAQKFIHLISSGHPDYDAGATNQKIAQLESKGIKPTSCAKLEEVCPEGLCGTCTHHGKVKSPIVAARRTAEAPAPVVQPPASLPDASPITIPPPPKPYLRLESGAVAIKTKTAEGDEVTNVIYSNDLYPVRRLVSEATETERHVWRVTLPRSGEHEFVIDADALYDNKKFVYTLANRGIFPHSNSISALKEYMIAYINELQKLTDAEQQHNHLGWSVDQTQFILPDKVLCTDGSIKPSSLSLGASRSSEDVHKKGTMERQIELLKFFSDPHYIPNQFAICAALGSPLLHATDKHGAIINMSGPPGASKSTTLYTGASLWGHPERYPLNGTNDGATIRARNGRVSTLANLPICVDEITLMPMKEAADLAIGISQANGRIRLNVDGTERKSADSYKSALMLTTANISLTTLLSSARSDSTAEAMRVFEMQFVPGYVHTKAQADEYFRELKRNYGHIGEVFMQYVVTHLNEVQERVQAATRWVDETTKIQSSERFWSAAAATALVAGEIANELGLLDYKVAAIKRWLIEDQFPTMRGVVIEHYSPPIGVLGEYMEMMHGDTLIINGGKAGNISNVIKHPMRQLSARYEWDTKRMWFAKKPFKDYCIKVGANYNKILDDLHRSKVILDKHNRKVLGAGTDYAKAQVWCVMVDMNHPEVTGIPNLNLVPFASSIPPVAQEPDSKIKK